MSPGNYDKTKTPPGKRRAEKGSKSSASKVSIYLDDRAQSAWRFLEGRAERQRLVLDAIEAGALKLGWKPPKGEP